MNWQRGLERVSVIWWGFWVLVAIGVAIGGMVMSATGYQQQGRGMILGGIAGAAVAVALHKLTCWVIAGFCAPK